MTPNWPRLFPDADFRMPMGLRSGDAAAFWRRWDLGGEILAERRQWLEKSPELFKGCLPEGSSGMNEALQWMHSAAPEIEADWVVLSSDVVCEPIVIAGEVVFPTAWSLPEKLGLPLSAVHEPVPALQTSIGPGIASFLARIDCGSAWERENWGMCATPELNQHPSRRLQRLSDKSLPENTWIRIESQFLTRLPDTRCILFGIRVSHHRLDSVAALPDMSARITRALRTMPESMAAYKGLASARNSLLLALGT